ncbi:MAG: hypothetical protein C5B49_04990, partial [Bdellovibrio sp.]
MEGQMAKILLVEDDEFFALAVQSTLEGESYQVVLAVNGKNAIDCLNKEPFDCVLCDVQMPIMNGLELARWMKENKPRPLILMTGFAEAVNTKTALDLNAANLLLKPFSDEELLTAIRAIVRTKNQSATPPAGVGEADPQIARESPAETQDQAVMDLIKIPTASLVQGGTAQFNLYKEDSGRMTKLITRGEPLNPKDPQFLGLAYLFTEKSSLEKILNDNILVAKAVAKTRVVDPAKKAKVIEAAIELIFKKAAISGIDQALVKESADLIACYMQTFNDEALWAILFSLEQGPQLIFSHTFAVTVISVIIAHAHQMSIDDCLKAVTVGIFHDIGETKLPKRLIETPWVLLSMAERRQVEAHVTLGVEMLSASQAVRSEICEIIGQHHENCDGTGYPRKLNASQIHPLARLVHVVDDF